MQIRKKEQFRPHLISRLAIVWSFLPQVTHIKVEHGFPEDKSVLTWGKLPLATLNWSQTDLAFL